MPLRKVFVACSLIAATVACLAARDDSGRSDFFYNGTEDEDAARLLVKSLARLENVSDAGIVGDELIHFTLETGVDVKFTALCYMTSDLDRIDFQIGMGIKEGISPSDKDLQRFLTMLNERYVAKFKTLDSPESPVLVVRTVYFQNHLRGELISSVLRSEASLLAQIAKEHPEDCKRFLR